jgi:chitinase
MNRSIAYYESWASHRACDIYMPSDIDPTPYTHINFAFALIDKDTSKVALSLQNDTILYDQMKKLRTASNHLQIWIAVGGYAVGAAPFSKLAASSTGRGAFVDSVCSFMDKYGFDGMDLDWEYPGATDMGGAQSDGANLVLLLKEYRAKCKNKGLSVTVPGGICEFFHRQFDQWEVDMFLSDVVGSLHDRVQSSRHRTIRRLAQCHDLRSTWQLGETHSRPTPYKSER